MNELFAKKGIIELNNSQNVVYVLDDPSILNTTAYKVLLSQTQNGFIKCAKMIYNGKIKLVYFTLGHKSLKSMMPLIDVDSFIVILMNTIRSVIDVKGNGFLQSQNIELSFDKIFVDQHTLQVYFIYLPIQTDGFDLLEFESDFRTNVIKMIATASSLQCDRIANVSSLLANGSLTLNDVFYSIKKIINHNKHDDNDQTAQAEADAVACEQPLLEFISIDATHPIHFNIRIPEFLIGKNPTRVNGVVDFNNAIGRVHCKVVYTNGEYFICDGDGVKCSTNGTYVNGCRLASTNPFKLKNGDKIRLANSDFFIKL